MGIGVWLGHSQYLEALPDLIWLCPSDVVQLFLVSKWESMGEAHPARRSRTPPAIVLPDPWSNCCCDLPLGQPFDYWSMSGRGHCVTGVLPGGVAAEDSAGGPWHVPACVLS